MISIESVCNSTQTGFILCAPSRSTRVICHKSLLWATALGNAGVFPCLHKTAVLLREMIAPISCFSKWQKVGRELPVACGLKAGTTWTLLRCEKQWIILCDVDRRSLVLLQGGTKKKERTGLQWLCIYAEFIFLQCWVLSCSSIPTSPQACSCADVQAVVHKQGRDTFLISCSDISTLWHLYLLQQTIAVHIANQYRECEGVRSTQSLVHYCTIQLFTVQ